MTRISEQQKLVRDTIVMLIEFDFTTAIDFDTSPTSLFITNERTNVTYDSQVYTKTAVQFIPPVIDLLGKLPQAKLKVFGQDSIILSAFANFPALNGTSVNIKTVQKRFLDGESEADVTQFELDPWRIDEVRKDKETIHLTLTIANGLEKLLQPALISISRESLGV